LGCDSISGHLFNEFALQTGWFILTPDA